MKISSETFPTNLLTAEDEGNRKDCLHTGNSRGCGSLVDGFLGFGFWGVILPIESRK